MKYFLGFVVIVVASATAAGLFFAGSPNLARNERFDNIRVGHLQQIESQIISYWQAKSALPKTLEDLKTIDLSGASAPHDPQTEAMYEYQTTSANAFSLCANFTTVQNQNNHRGTYPDLYNQTQNWDHGTGRVCFDRHIDPDVYPTTGPKIKE